MKLGLTMLLLPVISDRENYRDGDRSKEKRFLGELHPGTPSASCQVAHTSFFLSSLPSLFFFSRWTLLS